MKSISAKKLTYEIKDQGELKSMLKRESFIQLKCVI